MQASERKRHLHLEKNTKQVRDDLIYQVACYIIHDGLWFYSLSLWLLFDYSNLLIGTCTFTFFADTGPSCLSFQCK